MEPVLKDAIVLCDHLIQRIERLTAGGMSKEEFAWEVAFSGKILEMARDIVATLRKLV
jgi:hypothetical protein